MTEQPGSSRGRQEFIVETQSQLGFEEQHYPVRYWARCWGFSEKTIREWFRDESGPGILRIPNVGRRNKRDYVTVMIAPSAAARIYAIRTRPRSGSGGTREVM